MTLELRRYWITVEHSGEPAASNLGCGVTAFSHDDAMALLEETLFQGREARVLRVEVDVDVRSLDQKHVIPNMGVVSERGVWFPRQ